MSPTAKKSGWVHRLAGGFFGAPFRELPAEFGDPVPPELRVFEAKSQAAQHNFYQEEAFLSTQREQARSKPRDESLRRR
jgi:hypothetical protein